MNLLRDIITNPFFSIFAGLVGFFFGHRFELWRDRRREFNEAAEPLFAALEEERQRPSPMRHPSDTEFAIFRRFLPAWRRRAFDCAVSDYKRVKQECVARDSCGGVFYRDASPIVAVTERLLTFTARR